MIVVLGVKKKSCGLEGHKDKLSAGHYTQQITAPNKRRIIYVWWTQKKNSCNPDYLYTYIIPRVVKIPALIHSTVSRFRIKSVHV
jgi:hypothetical protein